VLGGHPFTRGKVSGNVFTDGSVRAPSCFDGLDAVGFERGVPEEEFAVFLGEDVVGDLLAGGRVMGWLGGGGEDENSGFVGRGRARARREHGT